LPAVTSPLAPEGLLKASDAPTANGVCPSKWFVASVNAEMSSLLSGMFRVRQKGLICAKRGCDRHVPISNDVADEDGSLGAPVAEGRAGVAIGFPAAL
jgi:hypothetical protein